jgi:hypothetical protein
MKARRQYVTVYTSFSIGIFAKLNNIKTQTGEKYFLYLNEYVTVVWLEMSIEEFVKNRSL